MRPRLDRSEVRYRHLYLVRRRALTALEHRIETRSAVCETILGPRGFRLVICEPPPA